jgi:hypothetical protein
VPQYKTLDLIADIERISEWMCHVIKMDQRRAAEKIRLKQAGMWNKNGKTQTVITGRYKNDLRELKVNRWRQKCIWLIEEWAFVVKKIKAFRGS